MHQVAVHGAGDVRVDEALDLLDADKDCGTVLVTTGAGS